MKKRLFPLLLALMLCLGLTVPALATNSDFTIENGVLKKYNGSGGSVTIPNGVTAIGDYAFERCNTVTSVILPNSLTSIGSSAFARCTNLTSINIPNSVTYIGSLAFEWCPNLTNMVIPDSVTSVGDFAFNMCSKLSTVTLPDGLKSIGKNSFSFTNLTSVDLPDSVEFIGESAFQNTGITHIKIPSSMTVISKGAFSGCYNLTSVIIHDRVTRIEETAFGSCISLTSIDIPDSVTFIGNAAFSSSALISITIPHGITEISEKLLSGCSELTSITIPEGVTFIGNGAFWECDSLKDIYYGGSEAQWSVIKIENEDVFHVHDTAIPKKTVIHYNFKQPYSGSNPAPTEVPKFSFTDVTPNDYFTDAVLWAVEKNITSGTSKTTFSPNATCSKAQILTFLWHANGSPEPTAATPFTDVKTADYFYKAALWAAEKGLVSGSTFGANTDCTRAMTVEYMWKAAGSPAPAGKADFDDVPANADYAQAVAWAVENEITSGTGGGNFSPAATCTRGQIVTFLYRAMGK